MAKSPPEREPYSNRALFERSADPIFVLNHRRRLRYVNPAWEHLVGQPVDEIYNLHCVRDRRASPLAQALWPPPEVMTGAIAQARRPVPPARVGPPWWDISFLPMMGDDGLLGVVGRIVAVGAAPALRSRAIPQGLVQLRQRMALRFPFGNLDGESPAAARIAQQARVAGAHTAPLLLAGEAGTGKRQLARTIHHNGITAERSFLAIDCPALPVEALELLLFGASGLGDPQQVGTIYLREPAALPRDLQARLLGWIHQAANDGPRIIAGFDGDPEVEVAAGRLLNDLFFAVSIQTIRLLPLRERVAELPWLVSLMLKKCEEVGIAAGPEIAPEALDQLARYHWPGNLSELEVVLVEAAKQARGAAIELMHLPEMVRLSGRGVETVSATESAERRYPLEEMLKQFEQRVILLAMRKSRGHKGEAARLLDLSRTELWRRMNQLGIGEDDWRGIQPREAGGDALSSDRGV